MWSLVVPRQRHPVTRARSNWSASATGTVNRSSVIRLPLSGSSFRRGEIGLVHLELTEVPIEVGADMQRRRVPVRYS